MGYARNRTAVQPFRQAFRRNAFTNQDRTIVPREYNDCPNRFPEQLGQLLYSTSQTREHP